MSGSDEETQSGYRGCKADKVREASANMIRLEAPGKRERTSPVQESLPAFL
jgi:hypothetical protein